MTKSNGAALHEFEVLVHTVACERWESLSHADLLELAARQFVTSSFMAKIISDQKAEIAQLHEQLICREKQV